jgi:hypothetical protein
MIGLFGGQITSHCQSVIFDGQPIDEVERRHLARDSNAFARLTPHSPADRSENET